MDEKLLRKLLRQVRFLNFLIVFFAIVFLGLFAVAGIFAMSVVREVRDARDNLTSVQQQAQDTFDVRNELCAGQGSLQSLLKAQTEICN